MVFCEEPRRIPREGCLITCFGPTLLTENLRFAAGLSSSKTQRFYGLLLKATFTLPSYPYCTICDVVAAGRARYARPSMNDESYPLFALIGSMTASSKRRCYALPFARNSITPPQPTRA